MRVPKELRLAGIEDLITQLDGLRGVTLTLPVETRYLATGGEAALVQALATWASQQEVAECRFSAPATAEELVARFSTLSAAILADRLSTIGAGPSERDIADAALHRLAILQSRQPRLGSRGPQIEVICADHLGRSFPATLYDLTVDQRPTLKRASALRELSRAILTTTMAAETARGATAPLIEPLAQAVYELFRNTDEHARTDLNGNLLRRSLRALQARLHSVTPSVLTKMSEELPPLHAYCRRLRTRPGRQQIALLELSVLDTGPGMAARWLGRQPGAGERALELDAAKACFGKGTSTKERPGAGLGLPNVIALMRNANGFLRLRTGRVSIYSDLGLEVGQSYGAIPELAPFHPNRAIAAAKGTLYTLLFPVEELA